MSYNNAMLNLGLGGGLAHLPDQQQVKQLALGQYQQKMQPLCTICGAMEGGKNVKRDHATAVGLTFHDLCGLDGATLVTRYHSLDTVISKINHMVASTPPDQRERMWRVGGRPICNSFVCPCCGRLLPATDANAHMVAALSAIEPTLDEQSRRRFGASKQRGDLAARRAMREMLLMQIEIYRQLPAGGDAATAKILINDSWPLDPTTGIHWCGQPPMIPQEKRVREEYRRFFKQKWEEVSNVGASSGGRSQQFPAPSPTMPTAPASILGPAAGGGSSLSPPLLPVPAMYAALLQGRDNRGADAASFAFVPQPDELQQQRHAIQWAGAGSSASVNHAGREDGLSYSVQGATAASAGTWSSQYKQPGIVVEHAASKQSDAEVYPLIDGNSGTKRPWGDGVSVGGSERNLLGAVTSLTKRSKMDGELGSHGEAGQQERSGADRGNLNAGLGPFGSLALQDGAARHDVGLVAEELEPPPSVHRPQQLQLQEVRSELAPPQLEPVQRIEQRQSVPVLPPQEQQLQIAPIQQAAQQFRLRVMPLDGLARRPEQSYQQEPVARRPAEADVVQHSVAKREQELPPPQGRREQLQQQKAQQEMERQTMPLQTSHQQPHEARGDVIDAHANQQVGTSGEGTRWQAAQQCRQELGADLMLQLRPSLAHERPPDRTPVGATGQAPDEPGHGLGQGPDRENRSGPGPGPAMHNALASALRAAEQGPQQGQQQEAPAEVLQPAQLSKAEINQHEPLMPHLGVKLEATAGLAQASLLPPALLPQLMLQAAGGFGAAAAVGLGAEGGAPLPRARSPAGAVERSRMSGCSSPSPEPEASLPKRRRPLQSCRSCHKILSHAQYYVHLADIRRAGVCRGAERSGAGFVGAKGIRAEGPMRLGAGPLESQQLEAMGADSVLTGGSQRQGPFMPMPTDRSPQSQQDSLLLLPPPPPPGPQSLAPLPAPLPAPPLSGMDGLGVLLGSQAAASAAGPGSSLLLQPPRGASAMSWLASGAPVLQDREGQDGDVRCSICKVQEGGKNLERDHATSLGFLLCDLCGLDEALVSRSHTVDAMREEVKAMRADTPPSQLLLWQVGGKPLCCCFVCPCCQRLLPSGDANKHMVAALDNLFLRLSEADQARFSDKLKTRGDLAARRAMREMLLEGPVPPRGLEGGVHYCGMPLMTSKEAAAQQRYAEFLRSRWDAAMGMPENKANNDDGGSAWDAGRANAGLAPPATAWAWTLAPPARSAAGDGGGGNRLLSCAPFGADAEEASQLSHAASVLGGSVGASGLLKQQQQVLLELPPGLLPPTAGTKAPEPHALSAPGLVSECAVCGQLPMWPTLQLGQWPPIGHLRAVAYILHDALHIPDLLQLADADPDTAKKVVGAMCDPKNTRGASWQLRGNPLCCCFPCPCCERVLYHGTAHRHMVAALLHPYVWKLLTPQQRARVQQVQQQPMPPHSLLDGQQQQEQALLPPPELSVMDCLEVMRDILLGVMASGQLQQLVRGLERCLCGAERMTEGETVEQRAALVGLQAAGSSLEAVNGLPLSRPGSAAAVAAVAAMAAAGRGQAPPSRLVRASPEPMDAAGSKQEPLGLPSSESGPLSGLLLGRPSRTQPVASVASHHGLLPLSVSGGRLGLPGSVAAAAPPLPISLRTGAAGAQLQQQLADRDRHAAGALSGAGELPLRRAGQQDGDEDRVMSMDDGLTVPYSGEHVDLAAGEPGPRQRNPHLGALLQQLATASAAAQPASAAAAAVAGASTFGLPQRRPLPPADDGDEPAYGSKRERPPRPCPHCGKVLKHAQYYNHLNNFDTFGACEVSSRSAAAPVGGVVPSDETEVTAAAEAAAAAAAAAGVAPGASDLQLLKILLKITPRDQLQSALREAGVDAASAGAGGGDAGSGDGFFVGAGIPADLAAQLAASGVDLSGLPPQPSRQLLQQQHQGRIVAPAASSAAGTGPGSVGSANLGLGARGAQGQRQRRQELAPEIDANEEEKDALSVLMTLKDQG
ncbi:hypothetical protein HYH02_000763 [Chlamydomonas schloesseri]|uniref:Uncharacterized protein n=1 Tax=Chlamydomonas schloesseri TaxID=2026947 RepID=A0A835WZ53_9CHLO|nr:hypothetical protein HYH02_000763 [Chlamydomonas schloesseri]|eukprot:KAG2454935.1 hypothetical protein HYH02_000763 [Chlamydomonas schloesseri]